MSNRSYFRRKYVIYNNIICSELIERVADKAIGRRVEEFRDIIVCLENFLSHRYYKHMQFSECVKCGE